MASNLSIVAWEHLIKEGEAYSSNYAGRNSANFSGPSVLAVALSVGF
jgi:hypothetical protein